MYYKKNTDKREVKCIEHAVSDIPNGVNINTKILGGDVLYEGTPIAKGEDGLYNVLKTAAIAERVTGSATSIKITKGSHFKVGDYVSDGTNNAQIIKGINKDNPAYDVLTLGAALGETIELGVCLYESTSGAKTMKVTPTAIVGATYSVEQGYGIEAPALLHCVVRESAAPAVNDAIKEALKLVAYI